MRIFLQCAGWRTEARRFEQSESSENISDGSFASRTLLTSATREGSTHAENFTSFSLRLILSLCLRFNFALKWRATCALPIRSDQVTKDVDD